MVRIRFEKGTSLTDHHQLIIDGRDATPNALLTEWKHFQSSPHLHGRLIRIVLQHDEHLSAAETFVLQSQIMALVWPNYRTIVINAAGNDDVTIDGGRR